MLRSALVSVVFILMSFATFSQQTREELEKQRIQLKREIDETQKLINNNKAQTRENLTTLTLISTKVNLQDRVVSNLNKDLRILDDNIYIIQRDINRYDRLLDTLKQEYAKSMVYAYKNRSNYEFLNFIFSADNFNDAIKRVAYLKSYRTYREMQGDNILRTQDLRRKRLDDIASSKQKKSLTLNVQKTEMAELETQKQEQNKIVLALKKNGKSLNDNLAAKKKQSAKVNALIAAAIKEAVRVAKLEALRKKEEADKLAAAAVKSTGTSTTGTAKPITTKTKPAKPDYGPSVLLNAENISLNKSFETNRGSLPWPVDQGKVIMHYGENFLESGGKINVVSITIASSIGSPVKSVFDGEVKVVSDDIIVIQHGRYFTTYSNLSGISVRKGDEVRTGQTLGKVSANDDGIGAIDFQASDENKNFDPEKWLRRR